MDKINRMKELINTMEGASVAYYKYDNPIMSDKQYDELFDELKLLEAETGIIMSNSPTQKVQGYVLDDLKKVEHTRPMLSANKTKSIDDIKRFIGDKKGVLSWKADGLTIVTRYKNGEYIQAITRGADGIIGEDVTHTVRMCDNLPMKVPYCANIEVRGECVMSWDEFNRINENMDIPFKHPRNVAAGTVRQLDPDVARQRKISYKAFELVQDSTFSTDQIMNIADSFEYLTDCGFDVVEHEIVTRDNIDEVINQFNPEDYEYPVDGLICTYDDYLYGKQLGETSHHPLNMIALKWEDELYETILTGIEWNTSKTGLINPVAMFEPTILDGAEVTRATLHNISYIENLQLGVGDTIRIYKANKIIPKVHDNLTKSNTWKLPDKCPICGGDVEIHNENGSKTLHCMNPLCDGKLLGKLTHAASKNALNIDGLSEATLEKFIDLKWLYKLKDIYYLKNYEDEMNRLEGFGKRSTAKLLKAIEDSRNTTLDRYLYAQSIPLIGKTASKDISKVCNGDIKEFHHIMRDRDFEKLTGIDGFGDTMLDSLYKWWCTQGVNFLELAEEFKFEIPKQKTSNVSLSGITFCITGSLENYPNRDALKEVIESMGGKVSGSVSSKTNYLICNTISNSSKCKQAINYNVKIITEEDFLQLLEC